MLTLVVSKSSIFIVLKIQISGQWHVASHVGVVENQSSGHVRQVEPGRKQIRCWLGCSPHLYLLLWAGWSLFSQSLARISCIDRVPHFSYFTKSPFILVLQIKQLLSFLQHSVTILVTDFTSPDNLTNNLLFLSEWNWLTSPPPSPLSVTPRLYQGSGPPTLAVLHLDNRLCI